MPENAQTIPGTALICTASRRWRTGSSGRRNFRKAYYTEREFRIERDARLDAKITGMDEKLDEIVAWQEAQQAKPAKRWEGLVEKALWAGVRRRDRLSAGKNRTVKAYIR